MFCKVVEIIVRGDGQLSALKWTVILSAVYNYGQIFNFRRSLSRAQITASLWRSPVVDSTEVSATVPRTRDGKHYRYRHALDSAGRKRPTGGVNRMLNV